MFGQAFLVNPITSSQLINVTSESKVQTKKIYLPKSTNWYDFWTGKKYKGGQMINAAAPIETMPVFVKAGSIVPMGPYLQYSTEKQADTVELRIYPGADASFNLYEDENDTYQYEKGQFATIQFLWKDKEKKLIILDRKGTFSGMLQKRIFNLVIVKEGNGVGVKLAENINKSIAYMGNKIEIKF
jgi:alpha-D-xyloside xylohydrolase